MSGEGGDGTSGGAPAAEAGDAREDHGAEGTSKSRVHTPGAASPAPKDRAAAGEDVGDAFAGGVVLVWALGATLARTVGAWLGLGCTATLLAAVILARRGGFVRRLLHPSGQSLTAGLAVGVAMTVATKVIYQPLAAALPFIVSDVAGLYGQLGAGANVSNLGRSLALLPVILGEELVWRGVVQTALGRRVGGWVAVPLGALIYALAHTPLGSPVLAAAALACGLVWGTLRRSTGGLVAPLVAHLVWDELVLLVSPVLPP